MLQKKGKKKIKKMKRLGNKKGKSRGKQISNYQYKEI